MRLALDTKRYVDLCKCVEATVRMVSTADAVFLPFVVVGELRAAFALGRQDERDQRVQSTIVAESGRIIYQEERVLLVIKITNGIVHQDSRGLQECTNGFISGV